MKPPPTRELERPAEISRALSSSAATADDRADLSDILPENLLSTSFIGRFDVSETDETKRGDGADPASQTMPPLHIHGSFDITGSAEEVPTPDIDQADDDFSDEETDGTKELERRPAERLPTVTLPPPSQRPKVGVGGDVWAAREYKRSLEPEPAPDELVELHTASGELPSRLDPFEIDPADETFHADGHEMVPTGSYAPELLEAHPEDVRDSRVDSIASGLVKGRNGSRNDWDEEAPSEIIEPSERNKIDPRRAR